MADRSWNVEDHLRDKPQHVVSLYEAFVELVGRCGPFTYSVTKTAIVFKGTRRGFAGCVLGNRGLRGYLDLQREVADERISSVAPYTKRLFVHHFRVQAPTELDETFAGWVSEAYAVGRGDHLRG